MEFEDKATIAILAIFIFCLAFVANETISGMQVAPGTGDQGRGQPSCVDSDGGVNPGLKGHIRQTDARGRITIQEDSCADANHVLEQICGSSPRLLACDYGCREGACLPRMKLIKKDEPNINKELAQIVQRQAEQQREEQQRAEQQRSARQRQCIVDCNKQMTECSKYCLLTIFVVASCQRDCAYDSLTCMSRC